MEEDSISMTPPVSPGLAEHLIADDDGMDFQHVPDFQAVIDIGKVQPCFSCLGEVRTKNKFSLHSDGYIQSNSVKRLLHGHNADSVWFSADSCELFGYHFVTAHSWQVHMDRLFMMARQQISCLQSLATGGAGFGITATSGDMMGIRRNVRTFLEYIKFSIHRHVSDVSSSSVWQRLLRHLHGLLLHIGRLSELSPQLLNSAVSSLGNSSSVNMYHLFHMHLDIHWGVLEILHIITAKFTEVRICENLCQQGECADNEDMDTFTQAVHLLTWDLVYLANFRFIKVSLNDYDQNSAFHCTCVRELWLLLIQLLNFRSCHLGKESFWTSVHPVFKALLDLGTDGHGHVDQIDSDLWLLPPVLKCENPVGLTWWLLSEISPLTFHECHHTYDWNKKMLNSNHTLMQRMLKKTLEKEPRIDEANFRCYLKCCLSVCQLWEPNSDVVVLLWDHFYKRLNDRFQAPGIGMDGFATISKSSVLWLEQLKRQCSEDDSLERNSFHLFLKLLSVQFKKRSPDGTGVEWKQMKGRFYSKFHQRRMQDLTEVGLVNFSSLFLVLAYTADMMDVVCKLGDLYGMLSSGTLDIARRCVVMKGLFVCVLMYIERGIDTSVLTDKLQKEFSVLCREFGHREMFGDIHHRLWGLICQYLDNAQDVMETSVHLNLSESKLIGEGITDLLSACSSNELCSVLSFIQTVLARLRMVIGGEDSALPHVLNITQHRKDLADRLWKYCYPFIREHSCTQTPPSQLTDGAVAFTLLSLQIPPGLSTGIKEDFVKMVQYFGFEDIVNAEVSCRYLCHIISTPTAVDRLDQELGKWDHLLVSAWARCSMQVVKSQGQLSELTRLVLQLDEVAAVFVSANIQPPETHNTVEVVLQFIKALGKHGLQLQDFKAKIAFRDQMATYFGHVVKFANSVLKNVGPPDALRYTYSVTGHLVKWCTHAIYIKSKPDCLLPSLLDRLILPRILLNRNKEIHPALLTAICDHLHLFVQGLGKLDYKKDPFIQRKLKDIIKQYYERFAKKAEGSVMGAVNVARSVHPLLASLSESCGKTVSGEASELRQYFLETITTDYLSLRGTAAPPTASMTLNFLGELFKKTCSSQEIARDGVTVLRTLLEYVLLTDTSSQRSQAGSLMEQILSACKKNEVTVPVSLIIPPVRGFVLHHIRIYPLKVMKVLEVMVKFHPNLIINLIPDLTRAVKESELKRGVGTDSHLRQVYITLLSKLGERGVVETQSLQ